ncbi:MAG: hypothetical protein ACK5LT_02140 [Lachnospirales bacterium]
MNNKFSLRRFLKNSFTAFKMNKIDILKIVLMYAIIGFAANMVLFSLPSGSFSNLINILMTLLIFVPLNYGVSKYFLFRYMDKDINAGNLLDFYKDSKKSTFLLIFVLKTIILTITGIIALLLYAQIIVIYASTMNLGKDFLTFLLNIVTLTPTDSSLVRELFSILIITGIFFFLYSILFFILQIRLDMSDYLYFEDSEKLSCIEYIKKSFKISKGKFKNILSLYFLNFFVAILLGIVICIFIAILSISGEGVGALFTIGSMSVISTIFASFFLVFFGLLKAAVYDNFRGEIIDSNVEYLEPPREEI